MRFKITNKKDRYPGLFDPDKIAEALGAERLDPNHPLARFMCAAKENMTSIPHLRTNEEQVLEAERRGAINELLSLKETLLFLANEGEWDVHCIEHVVDCCDVRIDQIRLGKADARISKYV